MKRVVLGLVLGLLIGTAGTAFAANSEAVQAVFAKFNLQINNQKAVEIEPLVFDGTTYLPVRTMGELLGFEVDYDDKTRTIIYKGEELTMTNGWITVRELLERAGGMVHNETNTVEIAGISLDLPTEDGTYDVTASNSITYKVKINQPDAYVLLSEWESVITAASTLNK